MKIVVQKNAIASLTVEEAYAAVAVLENKEEFVADGCDVYRGIHPQWGPTVIIFPPFGDPINVPMPGHYNITPAPLEPEVTVIMNADDAIGKSL